MTATNLPALISRARKALEAARTIDDLAAVRDGAKMLQRMAKGVKGARDAYNDCGEIVIYALAREGEELAKMEKAKGTRSQLAGSESSGGRTQRPPEDKAPTLKDMGISRDEASRAQRIATIPKAKLRAHLDDVKASGGEITTAAVLRLAKGAARKSATVVDLKRRPRAAPMPAQSLAEQVFNAGANADAACAMACRELIEACCRDHLPVGEWDGLFGVLHEMIDNAKAYCLKYYGSDVKAGVR